MDKKSETGRWQRLSKSMGLAIWDSSTFKPRSSEINDDKHSQEAILDDS
jgi:hypothetical protein